MNDAHIEAIFRYHPPHGDQAQRYERLRAAGGELARVIAMLCPESGERVLAIRRVQEAIMYANASIACNESPTAATRPVRCSACNCVLPSLPPSEGSLAWKCVACMAVDCRPPQT